MSKINTPWLLDVLRKNEMDEDKQLRVEAVRLAVKALESCAIDMAREEIVEVAAGIYEFIKGEAK